MYSLDIARRSVHAYWCEPQNLHIWKELRPVRAICDACKQLWQHQHALHKPSISDVVTQAAGSATITCCLLHVDVHRIFDGCSHLGRNAPNLCYL